MNETMALDGTYRNETGWCGLDPGERGGDTDVKYINIQNVILYMELTNATEQMLVAYFC